MRLLLNFVGILFSFSLLAQPVPHNLDSYFPSQQLCTLVKNQFYLPAQLETILKKIKSHKINCLVLGLSCTFPRTTIHDVVKKGWLQALIKDSEFELIALGHTLVLSHPKLPNYVIKLSLTNENNKFQNLSRIPNWLIARKALSTFDSLIPDGSQKIVLPQQKYFWYIGDLFDKDVKSPTFCDQEYIVIAHKLTVVPSSLKPFIWDQMTEDQKKAIKLLILKGKCWDISPSNINFTLDKTFAYIDSEQPDNSIETDFFAQNRAKELWNTHAGLSSFDALLGYPFSKEEDKKILAERDEILAQEKSLQE